MLTTHLLRRKFRPAAVTVSRKCAVSVGKLQLPVLPTFLTHVLTMPSLTLYDLPFSHNSVFCLMCVLTALRLYFIVL